MAPQWLPVVIAGGLWLPVQPHQLTHNIVPPYSAGALGSVVVKNEPKLVALPASCLVKSGGELSYSLSCAERSK